LNYASSEIMMKEKILHFYWCKFNVLCIWAWHERVKYISYA
jgi:hypothetical protein